MSENDIDSSHRRFKNIIKGKARKNLGKYISRGENIVRRYTDTDGNIREKVLMPMPRVDLPRFTWDDKQKGGVGQGKGNVGDPLSGEDGDGQGQAGDKPGEHGIEEVNMEEFVDILIEECELPDLSEKNKRFIIDVKQKFTTIKKHGPSGLRHIRRTLRENLKRQIGARIYDPNKPVLIPEKRDFRYKGSRPKNIEGTQALIIYMMDYSGSMGEEQKTMARRLAFWIKRCIRRFYRGIDERFIIHDTDAKEVGEDTFFKSTSTGGTHISSAFRKALEIIERDYPLNEWNIYLFHFSDGDNFDTDNAGCINLLKYKILSIANMFGYAQVSSADKRFKNILEQNFKDELKIRIAVLTSVDDTMYAIKSLLGKKK